MAGRTHGGSRRSRNLETRRSRWLNPGQEHADPSSQQTKNRAPRSLSEPWTRLSVSYVGRQSDLKLYSIHWNVPDGKSLIVDEHSQSHVIRFNSLSHPRILPRESVANLDGNRQRPFCRLVVAVSGFSSRICSENALAVAKLDRIFFVKNRRINGIIESQRGWVDCRHSSTKSNNLHQLYRLSVTESHIQQR